MLKLWSDEASTPSERPSDICGVCDGYAPLSVRVVQALTGGILKSQAENVASLLPGPRHSERRLYFTANQQQFGSSGRSSPSIDSAMNIQPGFNQQHRQTVLVCYIGGVTFSELAAYRLLNQRDDSNSDYYVCSTNVINSKRIFEEICR